jgi:hypothetical protein
MSIQFGLKTECDRRALCWLGDGDGEDVLQLTMHVICPVGRGAGKVSRSTATVATFLLALVKVSHGGRSWLMVAAMDLA